MGAAHLIILRDATGVSTTEVKENSNVVPIKSITNRNAIARLWVMD